MLIKFAQTNECQSDVYYFKVIKVTLEQPGHPWGCFLAHTPVENLHWKQNPVNLREMSLKTKSSEWDAFIFQQFMDKAENHKYFALG